MGLAEGQRRQEQLAMQLRAKNLRIMKNRREFSKIFGVDIKPFYSSVFVGFDVVRFDDWLMAQDEQYRRANAGELGEDVDCSMAAHIVRKYGQKAADMVRSFI
jgi:hypothetical protein